jgi:hypothetical protein
MGKNLVRFVSLSLFPSILFAFGQTGLGGVAGNMMEPVTLFSDFVDTGCLVIGVGFLFASIIKYVEHRRSPLMVPISTVIFLLIAGAILVCLPFLPLLTGYGVPYRLFK